MVGVINTGTTRTTTEEREEARGRVALLHQRRRRGREFFGARSFGHEGRNGTTGGKCGALQGGAEQAARPVLGEEKELRRGPCDIAEDQHGVTRAWHGCRASRSEEEQHLRRT